MSDDEVVVRLRLKDVQKFVQDAKSGKRSIEDLEKQVKKTGSTARRESSESGGLGLYSAAVGRLKYAVAGLALSLGAGAGAFGMFAVKASASLEQTEIGFKTLLGSKSAADKMIGDLQAFAAATPFQLTDLEKFTQRLLGMKLQAEQVIPTLTSIGDAVSSMGGSAADMDGVITALGQIAAKGVLSSEEIKQLEEHLIFPREYLTKGLGVNGQQLQKMLEGRQISSGAAIPMILKGLSGDYKGMMAEQSKTLSGIFSNVIDRATKATTDRMNPIRDMLKVWLLDIFNNADKIANVVAAVLSKVFGAVKGTWSFGVDIYSSIKESIDKGDWIGLGKKFGAVIPKLLSGLAESMDKGAGKIDWFDVGVKASKLALSFALGFISGLLDPSNWDWAVFSKHWLAIVLTFVGFIKGVKYLKFLEKIPFLGKLLSPLFKLGDKLNQPLDKLLKSIGGALKSHLWEPIAKAFGEAFPKLARTLRWHWNLFMRDLKNPKQLGSRALHWLLDLLGKTPIGRLFGWLKREFKNGVYRLFKGIFEWPKNWDAAKLLKTGWGGALVGVFVTAKDKIIDVFHDMWDGLKRGFTGMLNGMIDGLNGLMSVSIMGQQVGPQIPHVPGLATGGTVTSGGMARVGENGPELLHLPRGASVIPLPRVPEFAGAPLGDRPIHTTVMLDGKVLAQAVQRENDSRLARR